MKEIGMPTATTPTKVIQEFLLRYLQLSATKKARVDTLFELLKRSTDTDEQCEVAQAIQEIVSPSLRGSTVVVDMEEGITSLSRNKIAGYRRYLGQVIRKRRKELGMTQEMLAAKSGLLQSH